MLSFLKLDGKMFGKLKISQQSKFCQAKVKHFVASSILLFTNEFSTKFAENLLEMQATWQSCLQMYSALSRL